MNKVELQNLVEELRKKANEEDERNTKLITEKLQSYTDYKIRACVSVDPFENISLEVEFWNDQKGEWDFGSTFKLYYHMKNYRESRNRAAIEISTGTIGCYSKNNIYQIARIKMLSNLWDDIDNLENFFDSLKHTMAIVFSEKRSELEDVEYRERMQIRDAKKSEIKTKLQPGTELIYKGRRIKITKLTPKRVYYSPWCESYSFNEETNSYDSLWNYSTYEEFKPIDDVVNTIYYDQTENRGKCEFLN